MLQYAIEPTALAPVWSCRLRYCVVWMIFNFSARSLSVGQTGGCPRVPSSATYNSCIFCMREVVENPLTNGTIFTSPPLFITSSAPTIWSMV